MPPPAPPVADEAELRRRESVAAFTMEIGGALLAFGAPTPAVEDAMTGAARRLGVAAEAFATPTMLQASFGADHRQIHRFLRFDPGGVDLTGRARVGDIVEAVLAGRRSPEAGAAELAALRAHPTRPPAWLDTLAVGVAAAASARFFGGGGAESLVAGGVGLAVGLLERVGARFVWFERVLPCAAAFAASAGATAASAAFGPLAVAIVVVSALIVMLPGLSITTAVGELAARHLTAGTSRMALGAMTLVLMAFGVALGRAMKNALPAGTELEMPPMPAAWTLWAALAVAPAAHAVRLNALRRDLPAIYAGGVAGFVVGRFASERFGATIGSFVAAFCVTALANVWSRRTGRTAAIPMTPGLLMLVPGSLGFRSLASLVDNEVVAGVEGVFNVALVAAAIVVGLFLAMQVAPPREPAASGTPAR